MLKSNSYSLKKIIFGTTVFVALFSVEAAYVYATSRFLSRGLIDQLPVLLVLVSVARIVNYLLNLLLSSRFTVLGSVAVSLILIMTLTGLALQLGFEPMFFVFAALFIVRLTTVIYDTSLINLASTYVNQRQAKSFLPLMRGLMDLAILASSAFVYITTLKDIELEPLWLIIGGAVTIAIGLIVISRVFTPVGEDVRSETPLAVGEQTRNSWTFVTRNSRLYGLFLLLFFVFGGISIVFTYVYNSVFAENLSGAELTRFLTLVSFIAVLMRSVLNLSLLSSLINRLGLANLLLIYPWGLFLLVLLVMIFPHNLYLTAALFVFHTFSFYSYVTVSGQAMLGLVPKAISQHVFFLIKGLTPSLSALAVSLLMVVMLVFCSNNPLSVDFVLFVLAALTLIITLRIKKVYQSELLRSLGGKDPYLKSNAVELMGESVQMEQGERVLRKMMMNRRETILLRQKILASLVEINNPNSIRELLLVVEKDPNMRLRYYAMQAINRMFQTMNRRRFGSMNVTKLLLIDVINRVYEEDLPLPMKLEANKILPMFGFEVLFNFYKTHFANSPDFVKASIIETMAVSNDRGLITLLEPYLKHENLQIRVATIAALWPFGEMREKLMGLVINILACKENVCRMAALRLISSLKLKKMENYVLDLVAVPDKELSTMAVITAVSLGRRGALKVLMRKLNRFAMLGDTMMVEFVFRKITMFSDSCSHSLVNELYALDTASFNRLKEIFNQSNQFFDISLVEIFTS